MPFRFAPGLTRAFSLTLRRLGLAATRDALFVSVARQELWLLERNDPPARSGNSRHLPEYRPRRRFVASTSRVGVGQIQDSHRTPLGLHRIARKVGGGWPVGTVFERRQPAGYTWQGRPEALIAHRVLWLEGLEPGFNQGGDVDSFRRFIYVHGVGDETTLGRPASRGCVHLAAADLLPLYDRLPVGTLVWIAER